MSEHTTEQTGEQTPDSINEFTVVGEFGYNQFQGPFSVQKDGTVWVIDIHEDYEHPSLAYLADHTGESAALIADGTTCGGGIIVEVLDDLPELEKRVVVDQYALGGEA